VGVSGCGVDTILKETLSGKNLASSTELPRTARHGTNVQNNVLGYMHGIRSFESFA